MDLAEIEAELARLDAVYRPVARSPIDLVDPTVLGVDAEAQAVLRAVTELYEVAALSSDIDRYGMGSMRQIIHAYGHRRTA